MRMISSHFDNETVVIIAPAGTGFREKITWHIMFSGKTITLIKGYLNKIFPFLTNENILGISLLNNVYQLKVYYYLK